ncbi:MAG: 16S rRNA (adenine(1518)-N(6)/adenine(1519)-N(6))-dimethyltransferase RsmA [candidate division WOR-3 bacterium]
MAKRLGQHFLTSPAIARKIAQFAKIEDRVVVEIGAGKGMLTRHLAHYAREVFAIEIDPELALRLKQKNLPNVTVLNQDFLKTDIAQFKGCVIVGNIPYYITTLILEKLISERQFFDKAILTVQKEYGARLIAKPGTSFYGSITLYVNYYLTVRKGFLIPARFFSPQPRVSAMVIALGKKPIISSVKSEEEFFRFIQGVFRYRRKHLKNSLSYYLGFVPENLDESIARKRPVDLELKDFEYLYHLVYEKYP